jgi:hypothetical protein
MSVTVPATIALLDLENGTAILELESGADSLQLESGTEGAYVLDDNPVLAIPFYWLPEFVFFQMEPGDQVNPAYSEAWQNLATALMPEYTSEELYGAIHQWPSHFQQLAPPIFLPDGTGVTPPTKTKPSPGVGTGRTGTRKV